MLPASLGSVRHDWSLPEVEALFALPFMDLVFHAQRVHREHHVPNTVQMSTLLSIKTGACPEDCAYCPQSVHYDTGLDRETLLEVAAVREAAGRAKAAGATRFCMGAAYRSPKAKDIAIISEMIREVRAAGLETCATLGMLKPDQAQQLKDAGLDYYNHNLDTSPEYYGEIITTRTYQDRLDTLDCVRQAGLKVCCGGIVGMGESVTDRAQLLRTLANLPEHPESVPINQLVQVPGTPLHGREGVDPFDFVRTIAVARLLMPASHVRLSAGREGMSDEVQALCFLAGANSIFYGEKLLTTGNPDVVRDQQLFARLGVKAEDPIVRHEGVETHSYAAAGADGDGADGGAEDGKDGGAGAAGVADARAAGIADARAVGIADARAVGVAGGRVLGVAAPGSRHRPESGRGDFDANEAQVV